MGMDALSGLPYALNTVVAVLPEAHSGSKGRNCSDRGWLDAVCPAERGDGTSVMTCNDATIARYWMSAVEDGE